MKALLRKALAPRLAAALGLVLALAVAAAAPRADTEPRAITPRGPLPADEQAQVELFRRVSPSVVHITTLEVGRELFSRNVLQVPRGTGTGFVWDREGHVVTNFHVIQEGNAARVTLADQTTWRASLVGAFPDRDLAVLKIDAPRDKLVPIPLGTSHDLQVGQKVFAIGNPFGLDQTLTTGIVSALNREIDSFNNRTIRGVIQTDAAINPGNSGGPLLNSRGEVIGLTTAILSQVGQSAGIGFAIPIDAVRRILPQVIERGRVIRADLGIRRVFVTDAGLLVGEIVEGGPADRAGIQPIQAHIERVGPFRVPRLDPETADIITAVNGKPVRNTDELLNEVEAHAPGESVTLTVVRGGKQRSVKVTLGQS